MIVYIVVFLRRPGEFLAAARDSSYHRVRVRPLWAYLTGETLTQRAILFDFWQTLFSDWKERETLAARKQFMLRFLAERGHDGHVALDAAFESSRPWFTNIYLNEQRTPLVDERLAWVLNHCNIRLGPAELESLAHDFAEMGLMLDPTLAPNAAPMLAELAREFKLGIVSDTGYTPGRILRRHMAKHGVLEYFSAFSFSDETGRAKPHAVQFQNVLQRLQVEPANAVHCGDLPTHDVRGAKALGLTAVLYTGFHAEAADGNPPDYVISDWSELPGVVERVFS